MPGGVPPFASDRAITAAPTVRGACPSVAAPFDTADGALVRVRVPDGTVTAGQLRILAALAAPGPSIEITSRANLQLRALAATDVGRAQEALAAARLVVPRGDDRRNVVVSPTAGIDPDEVVDGRPLARDVAAVLAGSGVEVAPKFGVLLDGGGRVHLRGRRHAVALGAVRLVDGTVAWEVVVDGALPTARGADDAVVVVAPEAVPALVERLLGGAGANDAAAAVGARSVPVGVLVPPARPGKAGGPVLGWGPVRPSGVRWFGTAPVLGRLTAQQCDDLAALADRAGGEVRLSPWRGVVLPSVAPADAASVPEALVALGFAVDSADPAAHVVACVGRAGCSSGAVDAAGDARAIVEALRARPPTGRPPTVHVSGCAKACASRSRHDVTLMGRDDGTYDVHDGTGAPTGPTPLGPVVLAATPDEAIALTVRRTRW